MMKYVVGILVVGLLVCLCYIGKQYILNRQLYNSNDSFNKENIYLSVLQQKRESEFLLNGRQLSKDIEIYDKKIKYKWNEIIQEDKLVFFFSELYCDVCIEAQIVNLKGMSDSVGYQNILFLVNSFSLRYVQQLINKYDLKFQIYQFDKDLYQEIPDMHEPYFFILEKQSMRMQSVFIPQKENSESAMKYLGAVYSKYFKK